MQMDTVDGHLRGFPIKAGTERGVTLYNRSQSDEKEDMPLARPRGTQDTFTGYALRSVLTA